MKLITGGKPITPTGDLNLLNGNGLHEDMNGTTVVDGATKQEVSKHTYEMKTSLTMLFFLCILGVATSFTTEWYKNHITAERQSIKWRCNANNTTTPNTSCKSNNSRTTSSQSCGY